MRSRPIRCFSAWAAAVMALAIAGPRPGELPAADPGRVRGLRAVSSWAQDDPERALVTLAGLAAWLILAWLALGALAVMGGRSAGALGVVCRRLARLLLPRLLRDGLAIALGLSVVVGSAGAAGAAPSPPRTVAATTTVPSLDRMAPGNLRLTPLPAVPAPVLAPARAPVPRQPEAGGTTTEVVVHRGDCLWDVVARHLGPDATAEQIASAWPGWYAANRTVIGPDPGLLLPGQRLTAPPSR